MSGSTAGIDCGYFMVYLEHVLCKEFVGLFYFAWSQLLYEVEGEKQIGQ